jgi:hypothetical protein
MTRYRIVCADPNANRGTFSDRDLAEGIAELFDADAQFDCSPHRVEEVPDAE